MEKHKSLYEELQDLPMFWKIDLGAFLGAFVVMTCLGFLKLMAPKYIALMFCVFCSIEGIIMYLAAAKGKPRGGGGFASRKFAYYLFLMAFASALFYPSLCVETRAREPIPKKEVPSERLPP
jgi:hypothetical protein